MKVKLKLSAKYEGKIRFVRNNVFLLWYVVKSMSLKVILERSFFAVRIAKVGLLREPIRILLFILVQFAILLYTELYLFSDWPKAYSEFSNQRQWRHVAVKDTRGHGQYVLYGHGALFLRERKKMFSCFCFFKETQSARTWHDTRNLKCPWHDYCIICS